jgi:hypothetical protein
MRLRRARDEIPTVHQLVQARDARRNPCDRVERGAGLALLAAGRLDATIDLEPLAIDDPERVAPQGELVAARLHDLE